MPGLLRPVLPSLLVAVVALLPGCVSRKLFLRTEPPGATVFIDGRRAGVTPWEGEFPSYGTRSAEFVLPGHHRRVEDLELSWPWWQFPPLDIVTDLLVPWTIDDHRTFSFTLEPVDPEAATWDDAKAAYERLRSMRAEMPPLAPAEPAPPAPQPGTPAAPPADGGG